jgi:hypothetical protein
MGIPLVEIFLNNMLHDFSVLLERAMDVRPHYLKLLED